MVRNNKIYLQTTYVLCLSYTYSPYEAAKDMYQDMFTPERCSDERIKRKLNVVVGLHSLVDKVFEVLHTTFREYSADNFCYSADNFCEYSADNFCELTKRRIHKWAFAAPELDTKLAELRAVRLYLHHPCSFGYFAQMND